MRDDVTLDDVFYVDEHGERTDALREWRKLDAAQGGAYRELRRRLLVEGATAFQLARFMGWHRRIKRQFLMAWWPAGIFVRMSPEAAAEWKARLASPACAPRQRRQR